MGCSISQASVSVMTDLVVGKDLAEATRAYDAFLALMRTKGDTDAVIERGRGRAGGRRRVRGRVEVPGADQVRAAGLDGLEGRHGSGCCDVRSENERRRSAHDASDDVTTRRAHDRDRDPARPGGIAKVEDIEEAMRDVVDPELGINVVDLGLVYGVHVDDDNACTLDMTLTSAACPLTDVIEDQTNSALSGLVKETRINWVWMPPWGPDKITDEGREQLRALGFNV